MLIAWKIINLTLCISLICWPMFQNISSLLDIPFKIFLIYVNDIVVNIDSTVHLFADDTILYLMVNDPHGAARQLNSDLEKKKIHVWAERWLVKFNPAKSEALLLSRKTNKLLHPPLLMNNEPVHEVTSHKHLGIHLSNDGTWHEYINYITSKAWTRIIVMRKFKFTLDRQPLEKYTVDSRYLEFHGTLWNSSRYPYFDISDLQNWGKTNSINHI